MTNIAFTPLSWSTNEAVSFNKFMKVCLALESELGKRFILIEHPLNSYRSSKICCCGFLQKLFN